MRFEHVYGMWWADLHFFSSLLTLLLFIVLIGSLARWFMRNQCLPSRHHRPDFPFPPGPPPFPGAGPHMEGHHSVTAPFPGGPPQPSAMEILRQRYARGEIDAATFDQMRERLEASTQPRQDPS